MTSIQTFQIESKGETVWFFILEPLPTLEPLPPLNTSVRGRRLLVWTRCSLGVHCCKRNDQAGHLLRLFLLSRYSLKGSRQAWRSPSLPSGPPRGIQDCLLTYSLVSSSYVSLAHPAQTHENLIMSQRSNPLLCNQKEAHQNRLELFEGKLVTSCTSKEGKPYGKFLRSVNISWEIKWGNKMSLRYFPSSQYMTNEPDSLE